MLYHVLWLTYYFSFKRQQKNVGTHAINTSLHTKSEIIIVKQGKNDFSSVLGFWVGYFLFHVEGCFSCDMF